MAVGSHIDVRIVSHECFPFQPVILGDCYLYPLLQVLQHVEGIVLDVVGLILQQSLIGKCSLIEAEESH